MSGIATDPCVQASAQRSLQDEIQVQLRQQAGEPLEPSDDDEEAAGSDGGWGSPSGPGVASSGSSDEEASLGSPQHAPAASSQPSPPPAGPEELAPAAAAAALSSPPAAQLPPVRLLSFSSKKEGRVASHVEQLERMVSQLSKEVVAAAASRAGTPKVRAARCMTGRLGGGLALPAVCTSCSRGGWTGNMHARGTHTLRRAACCRLRRHRSSCLRTSWTQPLRRQ